ncbi:50S ribosomal protein L24 [Rubellicoccus peritrichatus]|uniref:Large ribosomal subunit protein uL24 n=1 Tax=Rubellicoccus peritrichatus TaxID=3080537 RepID=A0AAQ3LCE1_9BACT|nr:50S ribosomal protein L24 [Puniceicoccus sp. CR14]WOO43499.1 50S ribosomal protein L24 [Puniceicoccus sp. CR14]
MKLNIKRGDEVVVIAGAHKGSRGKVLELIPEKERVIVEGVRMIKRHTKPREQDGSDGGIVEREGTIHYSNVMKADRFDARKGASA